MALLGPCAARFAFSSPYLQVMMPFVLAGGLFANNTRLDPYWLWLKYLSPIQYSYSILVENEFSGLAFDCPAAPQLCRFADGQARGGGVAAEFARGLEWGFYVPRPLF